LAPEKTITTTISINMGFTHPEFKRLLPRALRSDDYTVTEQNGWMRVEHPMEGGKTINIAVSPTKVREITPLVRITNVDVDFVFSGFAADELDTKMAQIRRGFQKGGG